MRKPRPDQSAASSSSRSDAPDELAGFFAGRLPDGLFAGPPAIRADRDEIIVVGPIAAPEPPEGEATDAWRAQAEAARIDRFREDTRLARMEVADAAEARFGRKVAWGAECGSTTATFTQLSIPTMTRLRFDERAVLDTLVEANVARSRSEALAWCVRLVGQHEGDWIGRLRDALQGVDAARADGPG